MIVSFSWTTSALLAGRKTVTRRGWDASYAKRFKPGMLVQAYDRSPRNGGKRVAIIRILSVTYEADADAPDSDYEAEGFDYLVEQWYEPAEMDAVRRGVDPDDDDRCHRAWLKLVERGLRWQDFEAWRNRGGWSWVVRFELAEDASG